MKKLKLNKKAIVGILVILASILLISLIVIITNIEKPASYDVEKLSSLIINEYPELSLTEMDHFDVTREFGFEKNEVESALFLKSLVMDENGNDITENPNFIVIMNTEKYDYYHGILESHIDSNAMYTEDKKIFDLYNNAIIKSEENYVYMIVSTEAKSIEKLINE